MHRLQKDIAPPKCSKLTSHTYKPKMIVTERALTSLRIHRTEIIIRHGCKTEELAEMSLRISGIDPDLVRNFEAFVRVGFDF